MLSVFPLHFRFTRGSPASVLTGVCTLYRSCVVFTKVHTLPLCYGSLPSLLLLLLARFSSVSLLCRCLLSLVSFWPQYSSCIHWYLDMLRSTVILRVRNTGLCFEATVCLALHYTSHVFCVWSTYLVSICVFNLLSLHPTSIGSVRLPPSWHFI